MAQETCRHGNPITKTAKLKVIRRGREVLRRVCSVCVEQSVQYSLRMREKRVG